MLGKCGVEDKFDLTYLGVKFRLGIKPLSGTKIIKVSEQLCKLTDVSDEEQTTFQAMMQHAPNIRIFARCIAIATGNIFTSIITKAVQDLAMEDIATLWSILERQSSPAFFLNTMVSAKNLNLMKKK